MQYFSFVIVLPIVYVLMNYINNQKNALEQKMKVERFVVTQPKISIWVGLVCAIFFGALIVIMSMFPNDTATWEIYCGFIAFALFGLCLALYCLRWKVEVHIDIVVQSLLKRERRFTFESITGAKIKYTNPYNKIIVYSDNKKIITIEASCPGYTLFVARLKQENIDIGVS